MAGLVDSRGRPISSPAFYKKAAPPVLGEIGQWHDTSVHMLQLPGGGVLQFDLSRLTMADYRLMSTHYQINSSLSVLAFMLHQLEWSIEGGSERENSFYEEALRNVWTRLVRAFSQAFWAGYSPNILQWENDTSGRRVIIAKIKDIAPEDARVNWKKIPGALPRTAPEGATPPQVSIYDGIKQYGTPYPLPKENTVWYPLLMQGGDYYGRKLLKSAFQPWYFSTLMHLFSNRYYERFGEPVPVGRAPSDEKVVVDGAAIDSNRYMADQLMKLRSRSVVILPSDRATAPNGSATDNFEYDIEYLEAQMRGADFERYMTRLDEEISLALFTPLLLMRTADVGSYNLGVSHMQMYLWQLNAVADDWAEYINRYILSPLADYNFGTNAKRPRISFYKMGKTQAETNRAVLSALVSSGRVAVDLTELGQATGLSLEEVQDVTEPAVDPVLNDDREARVRDDKTRVSDGIIARIEAQAIKADREGRLLDWKPDFGFTSHMTREQSETLKLVAADIIEAGSGSLAWTLEPLKTVIGNMFCE